MRKATLAYRQNFLGTGLKIMGWVGDLSSALGWIYEGRGEDSRSKEVHAFSDWKLYILLSHHQPDRSLRHAVTNDLSLATRGSPSENLGLSSWADIIFAADVSLPKIPQLPSSRTQSWLRVEQNHKPNYHPSSFLLLLRQIEKRASCSPVTGTIFEKEDEGSKISVLFSQSFVSDTVTT